MASDWYDEMEKAEQEYDFTDDLLNQGYTKGYAKGKADTIARDYNTILIYEDTIRSMLLNTSQENNLIEWVDLNGKLNAITHIRHLIYDLE